MVVKIVQKRQTSASMTDYAVSSVLCNVDMFVRAQSMSTFLLFINFPFQHELVKLLKFHLILTLVLPLLNQLLVSFILICSSSLYSTSFSRSAVVYSLSPTRGSLAGGTTVTITGNGERERGRKRERGGGREDSRVKEMLISRPDMLEE